MQWSDLGKEYCKQRNGKCRRLDVGSSHHVLDVFKQPAEGGQSRARERPVDVSRLDVSKVYIPGAHTTLLQIT